MVIYHTKYGHRMVTIILSKTVTQNMQVEINHPQFQDGNLSSLIQEWSYTIQSMVPECSHTISSRLSKIPGWSYHKKKYGHRMVTKSSSVKLSHITYAKWVNHPHFPGK